MSTAYVVVTVLAAAANIWAAAVDFARPEWLLSNMTKVNVPHSWVVPLGAVKAAGAFGLLVGLGVPLIGTAAAAGLVLYFVVAALATVIRAPDYAQIPYPTVFLLLAVGALALQLAE
jgi:hypothetical protein